MSGLDDYRNRIDSLSEARADRDAACRDIRLAYGALSRGSLVLADNYVTRVRWRLDALALKIRVAASND